MRTFAGSRRHDQIMYAKEVHGANKRSLDRSRRATRRQVAYSVIALLLFDGHARAKRKMYEQEDAHVCFFGNDTDSARADA